MRAADPPPLVPVAGLLRLRVRRRGTGRLVTEQTPPEPRKPPTRLAGMRDLDLDEEIAEVLAQVELPRLNLGGSGPPGRAD